MPDHGHRQFWYLTPCFGTVVGTYPIADPNDTSSTTTADRRMYVDVAPHDNRGAMAKVPVLHLPGSQRQLRKQMTVLILFVDGNPQTPVVIGHNFNDQIQSNFFNDPLNQAHVNIDDHTLTHDETTFFARIRSIHSTGNQSAPDGSPAVFDVVFNSGVTMQVMEYDPDGYVPPSQNPTAPTTPPPPPTRAKFTFTMPSGLTLTLDEPQTGQSTVTMEHPSGASMSIDVDGNIAVTSPGTISFDADNVQVGDASGGDNLAFLHELEALTTYISTHVHTGVSSGSADSGPPSATPPTPVGTQDVFAT